MGKDLHMALEQGKVLGKERGKVLVVLVHVNTRHKKAVDDSYLVF